jgi:lysophospholipase L1-like esterase
MWWTTPSRRLRPALAAIALITPLASTSAQEPKQAPAQESATDPVRKGNVDGPWIKRHEQHLEALKPGNTELIFIGDSITDGWAGGGRSVWERYYAPRKAVNLGIGGDRTQHILWRLDHGALRGISPKVAVVMIGTNNAFSNSPDEIAAGVKAIVERLRQGLPKTKVLLLGVFPRAQRPDPSTRSRPVPLKPIPRIQEINERIKSLDDGRYVKYLDITPTFLNADGLIAPEIMPDYLHLNPKGYRLWADAIEPTLWTMMEGK